MKGGKDTGGYAWKGGKFGTGGKDGMTGKGGKFGKGEKGTFTQHPYGPPAGAGKQGFKGSVKEGVKGGAKGIKGGKGYVDGWTHDAPAAPAPAPAPPAAPAKSVWPAWTRDLPSDHQPSHASQQPSSSPAYRPQASCRPEPRPAANAPSTAFWPEWSSAAPVASPVESYGRPPTTHHSRGSYGQDWARRGVHHSFSAAAAVAEDSWGEEPAQHSQTAASSDPVWTAAGDEAFHAGEKASAQYTDGKWYPVTIAALDSESKTYSVTWELDGSTTANFPAHQLRKITAAARTPPKPSAAVDEWGEPVLPTVAADEGSAPASASVKTASETAVEEPDLNAANDAAFHAGEKASAQYTDDKWYPVTIAALDSESKTYSVTWELDESTTANFPAHQLRKITAAARTPPKPSAADDEWGEPIPPTVAADEGRTSASVKTASETAVEEPEPKTASNDAAFHAGEKASAQYTDDKWYPVTIAALDSESKTYSVTWELDGSTTANFPAHQLRKITAAARTPPKPSAAVDEWGEPVLPSVAADEGSASPASASVKTASETAVEEPDLNAANDAAFHAGEKASAQYTDDKWYPVTIAALDSESKTYSVTWELDGSTTANFPAPRLRKITAAARTPPKPSAAVDEWGEPVLPTVAADEGSAPASAPVKTASETAVEEPDLNAANDAAFHAGEKASAQYTDDKWYPVTIAALDSESKTYSVTWELDGSTTANFPAHQLRKITAAARTPPKPSAAVEEEEDVVLRPVRRVVKTSEADNAGGADQLSAATVLKATEASVEEAKPDAAVDAWGEASVAATAEPKAAAASAEVDEPKPDAAADHGGEASPEPPADSEAAVAASVAEPTPFVATDEWGEPLAAAGAEPKPAEASADEAKPDAAADALGEPAGAATPEPKAAADDWGEPLATEASAEEAKPAAAEESCEASAAAGADAKPAEAPAEAKPDAAADAWGAEASEPKGAADDWGEPLSAEASAAAANAWDQPTGAATAEAETPEEAPKPSIATNEWGEPLPAAAEASASVAKPDAAADESGEASPEPPAEPEAAVAASVAEPTPFVATDEWGEPLAAAGAEPKPAEASADEAKPDAAADALGEPAGAATPEPKAAADDWGEPLAPEVSVDEAKPDAAADASGEPVGAAAVEPAGADVDAWGEPSAAAAAAVAAAAAGKSQSSAVTDSPLDVLEVLACSEQSPSQDGKPGGSSGSGPEKDERVLAIEDLLAAMEASPKTTSVLSLETDFSAAQGGAVVSASVSPAGEAASGGDPGSSSDPPTEEDDVVAAATAAAAAAAVPAAPVDPMTAALGAVNTVESKVLQEDEDGQQ